MRRFLILLILALCFAGCDDDDDNEEVRVCNYTDKLIRISYERDADSISYWDDTVYTEDVNTWLEPNEVEVILVKEIAWDADIYVYYHGKKKRYDVDFNVWGWTENVYVRTEHFDGL